MKSEQNKMNNSSCGTGKDEMVRNSTKNSAVDSTRNQGDLREIRNESDLRDVTEKGGNKDRFNMTNS
jgi:hypothetical protein